MLECKYIYIHTYIYIIREDWDDDFQHAPQKSTAYLVFLLPKTGPSVEDHRQDYIAQRLARKKA